MCLLCVLVAQSCPTFCNPRDCSSSGSSVYGFSRQGYWNGLLFPSPEDLPNPGTEPRSPAWQADSLLFELQGNKWGASFPSPEDLPNPGIEPRSPAWQADSLLFELQGNKWGASLPLQWLRLPTSIIGSMSLIPSQGIKISDTLRNAPPKKK